jgi:G3E family GTPase
MTTPRVPFSVIGGFLGSGKTTLLNRWLRHAGGKRLAVLVNDFGALNIDAGLVEAGAADTIALTNGCVCCQIGDDLSLALMRVLDSERRYDSVVVEASGVADPWRIAQLGRADPRVFLDAVVVLVDAGAALAQSRDALLADTLERQLKAADLVVINKIDLASAAERVDLHAWIARVCPAVNCVETAHAEVPPALLSGAMLNVPEAANTGVHHEGHDHADPLHGDRFESWSCRPARTFESAALRDWLRAPPPGLLRLKGVLRTSAADGRESWSELQFAGRQGSLRGSTEPQSGAALVAIALRGRLPRAKLVARFESDPKDCP